MSHLIFLEKYHQVKLSQILMIQSLVMHTRSCHKAIYTLYNLFVKQYFCYPVKMSIPFRVISHTTVLNECFQTNLTFDEYPHTILSNVSQLQNKTNKGNKPQINSTLIPITLVQQYLNNFKRLLYILKDAYHIFLHI